MSLTIVSNSPIALLAAVATSLKAASCSEMMVLSSPKRVLTALSLSNSLGLAPVSRSPRNLVLSDLSSSRLIEPRERM